MTDFGVVFEFYYLSQKESQLNNKYFDYCGGIDTFVLFILSMFSLFTYRRLMYK